MTGWHVDDDTLRRYVERTDSLAEGASVEQHLLSCEQCRARVNTAVDVIDLAAVWDRTRDVVEVPRPSVFERLLRGAGLPAHEARLVAVASAFRGVWLVGVAAVLAFAALAAAVGHARGLWFFLAVAPLAPCLVVAFSYDRRMDPALEPEMVTPYPALRLILLRTIAVLALALPAVLLLGLVVPGEAPFAWLLPAVGFVAVVLAASTWVSPLNAAMAVSAAWLMTVWLVATRSASPAAVLQARTPGGLPGAGRGIVRNFSGTPTPPAPASTLEVAMTASISLRGVGRTFGATRALADVDLDLEPGVIGLLGPNGAGKTTLLRLLATALPPSQGEVRVLGRDPEASAERTDIRRRLGYLPQELGFPRGFTAFAFVDYIALLKEWTQPAARHAEVRRVLDQVGLSDLVTKRIRAMSGGQRRRVALAQALLGSPPVLILDEPTSGVDPEQRVTLRTVLAEIARTSIVVLSTHQTEDVAALCERVIVLDQGRVRYDGQVTELVRQAAGRVWLADQPDPAATVSWRTGTGRYRNVAAHARDGVEHVEPSLEDAYLLLRGELPDSKPAEEVAS